jgi:hypothetical protein
MTDYSELERLAEAATGGRWVTDGEHVNEHGNVLYAYVAHEDSGVIAEAVANCLVKTDEQCRANAAFIAAANPAVVLALLAENEDLRGLYQMHKETETREMRDLKAENVRLKRFEIAYEDWTAKTEWVQETVQGYEVGMHRADVLHKRCRDGAFHQQAQADRIKELMAEVQVLRDALSAARPYVAFAFSEGMDGSHEAGLQLDAALTKDASN